MLLLNRFSIHVGKGVLHAQASLKRNAQTGLEMVLSTSVLGLSTQNQLHKVQETTSVSCTYRGEATLRLQRASCQTGEVVCCLKKNKNHFKPVCLEVLLQ